MEEVIGLLEKWYKLILCCSRRKYKSYSEDEEDLGSKEIKGNDNWDVF